MKVTRISTEIIELPEDDPLARMPETPERLRPFVLVEVATDTGIVGIGLTLYGGPLTGSLRRAVGELGELIIGSDPMRTEEVSSGLRAEIGLMCGPGGIFLLALSALDIALWDIKGKALDQPLWKLLGGARETVDTYASGSLRRGLNEDETAVVAKRLLDQGFRAMKAQLGLPGNPTPAQEVRRMQTIREVVGPDVKLMADARQKWRVEQAIDIGQRMQEVGLFWLEDVTACDDYQGLSTVNSLITTPIAGGEFLWGPSQFRQMVIHRSVDYVMIDTCRVGGITQWMKVAGMAEAFNMPVLSHVMPEINAHLIAATPNGVTVEYMPWTLKLFHETPLLTNGQLIMPNRPGLGLELDQEVVARYRVR
jgi:L-alanine-DL-glutamate epimerase-like enolase superfamily enzyme